MEKIGFCSGGIYIKEIKIELLGIATILLGIVLKANNFFGYFLGVLGFGIAVAGCFLKDKYK
ncbi:MAG: hypothetical protein MSB08_08380 [Subdoligranulum sp.]|nr:hypothetical protein [Subdoligranulum sp.]MCI7543028.1 hypothetical protein [Subdoligranulum sp.]MDD7265975.1 hypothetical protein [Subdoligranulum sp.]MDY5924088.1 hypothetical protein [Oscillospiraceae bacterium]